MFEVGLLRGGCRFVAGMPADATLIVVSVASIRNLERDPCLSIDAGFADVRTIPLWPIPFCFASLLHHVSLRLSGLLPAPELGR